MQHKGLGILHIILLTIVGVVSVSFPAMVSLLWAYALMAAIWGAISNKTELIWYGIAASPMLEVWARMSKSPFVPFESGKYFLLITIALLFIHHAKVRSEKPVHRAGLILMLFLLPSLLVALPNFNFEQWIFNGFGVLELAILLLFAARERWTIERFCKTLWYGLIPVIPILVYLTVKTPAYNDLTFVIGANFDAGGGFGSNQVSTILGNGVLLTTILLLLNYPIFRFKLFSFVLLAYLLFRGMLTFSRGGIMGAAISVCILIIPAMFANPKAFLKYSGFTAIIALLVFLAFSAVNNLSGNKLLLRYEGETKGTAQGTRQKTINTITSGRSTLASADLAIFQRNILFGVGPGAAKKLRVIYSANDETASHTEFSRLLSEHGLGGLFAILTLLVFPIAWIRRQNIALWRSVSAALFVIALFTSFHSAMRTNTTSVYYALAAIPVLMNSIWVRKLK